MSGSTAAKTLDVEISFCVGKSTVPLDQLATLKEGFIFETDRLVGCPVTLESDGKPIGTAELVDVSGRLGIRVIEWRFPEKPAVDLLFAETAEVVEAENA